MPNIILLDTAAREQLLPFTYSRPIADIRCGIWTNRERWESLCSHKISTLTTSYLQEVYPCHWAAHNLLINAQVIASKALVDAALQLKPGQKLCQGTTFIAAHLIDNESITIDVVDERIQNFTVVSFNETVLVLNHIWDIFLLNERAILQDFNQYCQDKISAPLPSYVQAVAPENIFIEEGAQLSPCILNAKNGPIYIGKNAEIMDGACLRGPIALGTHATIKMGAKIYGGTTIGPECKIGGEVSNTVFFGNSNKGHDGFIGNAVIGEWCNLGADTNCSNLKNNYDTIKVWDIAQKRLQSSGLQFCGLMMGDHSKTGINTMFNTATVVGFNANIFGAGFPDKFVPSFSWGATDHQEVYALDKAMETAERMMQRRNQSLSAEQRNLFIYLFENRKLEIL